MASISTSFRKNRTQWITLIILAILLILAIQGMSTKDAVVTVMRGLSVAAVTFLVASGFSIIFGLMDVLNLAHGTLFMIGAYVGWTAFVRPDTVVDLFTPLLLLIAGFMLAPLLGNLLVKRRPGGQIGRLLPWIFLILALVILAVSLSKAPIAVWDSEVYTDSPIVWTQEFDAGRVADLVESASSGGGVLLVWIGVLLGSLLLSVATLLFSARNRPISSARPGIVRRSVIRFALLVIAALAIWLANTPISSFLFSLDSILLFVWAIIIATLTGVGLGGLMESSLIRPLYERGIYQIMLTFGLAFIGTEIVRAIWGRSGFTMPRPALFGNTGDGCPATGIGGWLQNSCSTIVLEIGGETARLRTYNEIFLIVMGVIVLIVVWLILQRTRLGMIIRAGVQDSEMVEALGINVRRVFTLVFALGVGLAALGGVLSAPATGLSDTMGANVLLTALIALAIGGLTSYPGAAVGSLIVGLLQQFIIKYGSVGIPLPFLEETFKPSPPLVPASTVLLMVIVLLVMPQGLFGRKE
ncbi:MAG: hypothetical protein J5I90_03815 [Caldilineales bacterium]|nr:hypothetical protein [Caldilineales bacterium]